MEKTSEIDSMDLATLVSLAENLANEQDGHLSIFRFTTGWKVILGTPNLDTGQGREEIKKLKAYKSLRYALASLILKTDVGLVVVFRVRAL